MFAVFISGGKQHKVRNGGLVTLEKLDLGIGDKVTFDQVLMLSDGKDTKVGTPHLAKTTIVGEIVEQSRAKKVRIIKFRRRKHHMKRQGHRQYQTVVRIVEIAGHAWQKPENKTADKPEVKKAEAKTEAKVEKKVSTAKKADADKAPVAKKAPAKKPAAKKESKAAEKKAPAKKTEAKKSAAPKKAADKKSENK